MQINSGSSFSGYSSASSTISAAIQRGQSNFDASAQRVVNDTQGDPAAASTPAVDGTRPDVGNPSDLPTDLVAMQSDALMNHVLYSLFHRQQEQQQSMLDMVKAAP